MTAGSFQRARQPAQKQQRREALLHAAATLLDEHGLEGVSLSAIARQAGLAKSNVYRYFDSREQILLELFAADEAVWVGQLELVLVPLTGSGDTEAVASVAEASVAFLDLGSIRLGHRHRDHGRSRRSQGVRPGAAGAARRARSQP